MPVLQDMRVLELLASRICHDLISPVGAINNGLELMTEMGDQVGEEATKLIGHSAEQAARRLRLFRVCYGAAGADPNMSCDDVLITAREFLNGSRVSINWPSPQVNGLLDAPLGFAKVLLNMVLIAAENMVHGGTIEVTPHIAERKMLITANGRGAGQRTEAWAPLQNGVPVADLTPRSIHPHVTGRLADHYGLFLSWSQPGEDQLTLGVSYPAQGD